MNKNKLFFCVSAADEFIDKMAAKAKDSIHSVSKQD